MCSWLLVSTYRIKKYHLRVLSVPYIPHVQYSITKFEKCPIAGFFGSFDRLHTRTQQQWWYTSLFCVIIILVRHTFASEQARKHTTRRRNKMNLFRLRRLLREIIAAVHAARYNTGILSNGTSLNHFHES